MSAIDRLFDQFTILLSSGIGKFILWWKVLMTVKQMHINNNLIESSHLEKFLIFLVYLFPLLLLVVLPPDFLDLLLNAFDVVFHLVGLNNHKSTFA